MIHSRTTCSTGLTADPWYADIVNFMVLGYVPPGANKEEAYSRKSFTYMR